MSRILLLMCAALVASPTVSAWGATPIHSDLSTLGSATLQGALAFDATNFLANLTPDVASGKVVHLSWARAEGYVNDYSRIDLTSPILPDPVSPVPQDEGETRHVSLPAGETIAFRCAANCKIYLASGASSILSAAGNVSGTLEALDINKTFFARYSDPSQTAGFQRVVPAGSFSFAGAAGDGLGLNRMKLAGRGDLQLLVHNAAADIVTDGGTQTLDAQPRHAPIAGTGDAFKADQYGGTFFVLNLTGAALSVENSVAEWFAPAPVGHLTGAIAFSEAAGQIQAETNTTFVNGDSVRMEGDFNVQPLMVFHGKTVSPLSERPVLNMKIGGDATRLYVGAAKIVDDSTPLSVAGSLSILAIIIALFATRPLWLGVLYTRIDRTRLLSNPTRMAVLAHLSASPGATASGLARELRIARAVILHHLAMLAAHRLVVSRREGWERRHYLPHQMPSRHERSVLDDPTRRRIVSCLITSGPATQNNLVMSLGLQQRLVSYHLAKLEREGLVVGVGSRPRRFGPTPDLHAALEGRAPAPSPATT